MPSSALFEKAFERKLFENDSLENPVGKSIV